MRKQTIRRLGTFIIPIKFIDDKIKEGSYCFGSVREMYIRDCYFRHHNANPHEMHVVMDLGANRGLFSTMATSFATKIIAVEANPKYREVFEYNMSLNNFSNYSLVNSFVAASSKDDGSTVSVEDLISRADCDRVDFLKMDIEGAEFSLFESLPFNRIKMMTMEVHSREGDPALLIAALQRNNFNTVCTDHRFRRTSDPANVDYIYAVNTRLD